MFSRGLRTRGLDVIRASSRRVANRWNAVTESYAETPLIAAARNGDTIEVERLLRAGTAHPDFQDSRGCTALHYAAARAHAETAACLLAYGANHTLLDNKGRTSLGPKNVRLEDLHAIRQRYHRFRHSNAESSAISRDARNWVRDLGERGIVKVSGLIQPDELDRMRSDFQGFVRNLEGKVARGEADKKHYFEEEHRWPNDRAFISNNAFKYSPQLIAFSCKPEILQSAHLYLGKVPFI